MASKRPAKPAHEGAEGEAPKASFETKLTELEEIVRQLEEGEKPLDESLELYEKGVSALKVCHQILDRAEKRIRTLVQRPDGEVDLRDADREEDKVAADAEEPAEGKSRRRSNDSAQRIQASGEEKTKDDRGSLFGGR